MSNTTNFAAPTLTINFAAPLIVIVGQEQTRFYVHADVLSRTSPQLGEFCTMEPEDGSIVPGISLPDHDPDLFNVYLQWLYSGSLFSVDQVVSILDPRTVLAMCYVMGEKLRDRIFRNTVIRAMLLANGTECPCAAAVDVIYDGTPHDSPARRLMVDLQQLYGGGEVGFSTCPQFTDDVRTQWARRFDRFRSMRLNAVSQGSTRMHRVAEEMPCKRPARYPTPTPPPSPDDTARSDRADSEDEGVGDVSEDEQVGDVSETETLH